MIEFKRQDRLKTRCWRKSKNCQTQAARFSKLLGRRTHETPSKGSKAKVRQRKSSQSQVKLQCQLPRVLSAWSYTGWAFSFLQQILTTHGSAVYIKAYRTQSPQVLLETTHLSTLHQNTSQFQSAHRLYSSVGTDSLSSVFWKDVEPSPNTMFADTSPRPILQGQL